MLFRFFRKPLAPGTCWLLMSAVPVPALGQEAASKDLNTLSLEVAALQELNALDLSSEQLKVLAGFAKETVEKPHDRDPARVNLPLRKAMLALHAALARKKGPDVVLNLQAQVAEIKDLDLVTLDDGWETTVPARVKVRELFRLLKPSQAASLMGKVSDSDPEDLVREALEQSQKLTGKEWKDAREEAVAEISRALAGPDEAKAAKIGRQVALLLHRAHAMKKNDFKKQRRGLHQEARRMTGSVRPIQVLENRALLELARFLSNPGLPGAIDARLARISHQP